MWCLLENVGEIEPILKDNLFNCFRQSDNIFSVELVLPVHFLTNLQNTVLPIQHNAILVVIENSISDFKSHIKESLIPRFESSLNRPPIVAWTVDTIEEIVILGPDELLDLLADWETLEELVVLVGFVDVAFWTVLATYYDR